MFRHIELIIKSRTTNAPEKQYNYWLRNLWVANTKRTITTNTHIPKAGLGASIIIGGSISAFFLNKLLIPVQTADKKDGKEPPLKTIFLKYASIDKNGEKYMTAEDFVRCVLPKEDGKSEEVAPVDVEKLKVLFKVADADTRGLLSYPEFLLFLTMLSKPEAEYKIAFQIFDRDGDGFITRDEFKQVLESSTDQELGEFDVNSEWLKRFFGKAGNEKLSYYEFTQVLAGLQNEISRQQFSKYDKSGRGFISTSDMTTLITKFRNIISTETRSRIESLVKRRYPQGKSKFCRIYGF